MGIVRTTRKAISVGGAALAAYRFVQHYRARKAGSPPPGPGTPERAAPTRA
jgi:hypothetical protein